MAESNYSVEDREMGCLAFRKRASPREQPLDLRHKRLLEVIAELNPERLELKKISGPQGQGCGT